MATGKQDGEQNPVVVAGLLAGLIALLVSVASWPLQAYGSDPVVVREEARAMLLHGRLAVDAPAAPFNRPGEYYVLNPNNGLWYSKYGVFGAIASVPPMLAERLATGELPTRDSETRTQFLNYWNTLLTVAVAGALVRIASLYTRRAGVMVAFAVASLFATFLWNYARAQSSEIVQVLLAGVMFDQGARYLRGRCGMGMLPMSFGLGEQDTGRMPVPRVRRHLAVVWACVAALVLTRVYFLTLLPAVVLIQVWDRRWWSRVPWAMLPAVGILLLVGAVNTVKFGGPFLTGYHQFEPSHHRLTWDPGPGLWGFFVSAEKGIWWHYPLVAFALLGWRWFAEEYRREAAVLLVGTAAYVLPLCTVPSWAGNWGYGPRYLVFGLPLVSVPVVLVWDRLWAGRGARALLGQWREPSPGPSVHPPPRGEGLRAGRGGAGKWALSRQRALLGAMGIVLAVSVWLNFQVNRLEFFAAERVRIPLEEGVVPSEAGGWQDDYAPYAGRAYFDRRPWGLVIWDIFRCEGRAERHPLWPVVEKLDEDRRESFRLTVWQIYRQTNWYWETLGRRFDDNRLKVPADWKGPK